MRNLQNFLGDQISFNGNTEAHIKGMGLDQLKELRELVNSAIIEAICTGPHESIMQPIFDPAKYDMQQMLKTLQCETASEEAMEFYEQMKKVRE